MGGRIRLNYFNQNSGSICISLIVFILILIGAWFVYKSYQEHRLKENLRIILADYRNFVVSTVEDAGKRDKFINGIDYLLSNFDKYSRKEIEAKYDSIKRQVNRYDLEKAIRIIRERYDPPSRGTPVPIPDDWNR
jgi:predicted negative regulator of RcsB-dependent stress response